MEFINVIIAFPTVVYTVMLGLALFYWTFVIGGLLDPELFDIDLDLDVDVDLDLDVDVDVDADANIGAAGPGAFITVLSALGIGRVPFMIVYSVITFVAWILAYAGAVNLLPLLDNAGWAQGLVFAGAFLAALPISSIVTHPLKKVFKVHTKASGKKLRGRIVTVLTGSVDSKFGQGRMDDGGADLVISIRNEDTNNGLKKGSEALIIGYDDDTNVYHVESMEDLLPSHDEEMVLDAQEEVIIAATEKAQTVEGG